MSSNAPSDDLVDLAAEQPAFARLVRVAKALFGVPFADVVLLRNGFVWRSSVGASRTDDEAPLAAIAMQSREAIWIENAAEHPDMADHPLIAGETHLRFYAGAPIVTSDGVAIGALIVVDIKPRAYDRRLAERLEDLAKVVGSACDQARERQELTKAQRRLNVALQIADVHVWEMDLARRTLEKAGAEDTFFEQPATYEDLYRNPIGIVHRDDRARVAAAAGASLDGLEQPIEYRVKRADGKEVWSSSVVRIERDAEGTPLRFIGAMQNITRRKQAEALLVRASHLAEAANRAKSEFLANMSHELRTPLNGVMGIASVLARTRLTRAQRDMVRLVANSAQSLEHLLADILDLARIEAGRLEIRPEPFDLASSLQVVADLYAPCAQAKGLAFTTEIDPVSKGCFVGDAMRIRQVVSNLVSNAMKFTSAGSVTLRVSGEDAGDSARLRFEVCDTGIGFSAEDKAHVFARFEQADGSMTRRYGGSGLGLAICQSLLEAMGGELAAESTPGAGSTFSFVIELPRVEEERPAKASEPALEPDAPGVRVLYAEDNPANQKVVELILGAAGVDIDCVENGALAVEAWAQGAYDVILMDLQMPVMDGLSAIRAIRAREFDERRPRTPIYTLTANALPEQADAAFAAGVDGHLTKPTAAPTLLNAVVEALHLRGEPERSARA